MSTQGELPLQRQDHSYHPHLHYLKDRDSLPSLTNSENTLDESSVSDSPAGIAAWFTPHLSSAISCYTQIYMDMQESDDINDVLDDVIVKINRITDHLRDVGEYEAANHFTKDLTSTFRGLYNVIAPWEIQKCLMHRPEKPLRAKTFEAANPARPTTNSWASIAATEPVIDKNGIIKFRPSDGVKRMIEAHPPLEAGQDSRDRRVVWIRPWPENRPLSEVSKKMSEIGAIYSMAFAPEEQAVCIIFQHGHCAAQFMHNCAEHVGRTSSSPFGKEYVVIPGLPYPMDENLRRMEPPHNARRRLTFARSQLFTNGMTEGRFREDIESLVGRHNIELLWLFNTGNATVVFSAVPLAKIVRERFLAFSRTKRHAYEGIMVAYSHDPCERELHLVSQIPGHANFIGSNSKDNILSGGRFTRSSTISSERSSQRMSMASSEYTSAVKCRNPVSKSVVDEDGWQTVQKKR